MRHLRVLVVDDSAYNRRTITELLQALPEVEVVGKATDGDEALRMVSELQPDLITLDLEMPRMDGFTFLRLLMARRPTPVIIVSGYSAKENVFRALELGAIDFIAKPTRAVTSDLGAITQELSEMVNMVRQLSPAGLDPALRPPVMPPASPVPPSESFAVPKGAAPAAGEPPKYVVVVAASTGGPTALVEVFRRLPAVGQAAVVVAQHMPERFTKTFAERLNRLGGMRVREASGEQKLTAGTAYVCPGGRCLEVEKIGGELVAKVVGVEATDRYVPSCDRLFASAAKAAGDKVIGVVLTGMGDDGARGVMAIKDGGGMVLAEAADTAVIYGMPGAAVRTGAVDRSLPLRQLAERLAELVS